MPRLFRPQQRVLAAAVAVFAIAASSLSAAPAVSAQETSESLQEGSSEPVPTILSTDLSIDRDPDDWFDAMLFLTLDGIEPAGIVLERYATDEVVRATRRLLEITDQSDVPVVKGVQGSLGRDGDRLTAPDHHDGARFLIETLRSAPGRVRLIAVGGLTNEALAYYRQPELFHEKVEAIYFAGGNLSGEQDTNVKRDTLAAELILNSPLPIRWVPCTPHHKQKLSGERESEIAAMDTPAAEFLTEMLRHWRKARPAAFLERTDQRPGQGKNLWSLPCFLDAAGTPPVGELVWTDGHAHFDAERWTWFETDPAGPDRMLLSRDAGAITAWLVDHISTLGQSEPEDAESTLGLKIGPSPHPSPPRFAARRERGEFSDRSPHSLSATKPGEREFEE